MYCHKLQNTEIGHICHSIGCQKVKKLSAPPDPMTRRSAPGPTWGLRTPPKPPLQARATTLAMYLSRPTFHFVPTPMLGSEVSWVRSVRLPKKALPIFSGIDTFHCITSMIILTMHTHGQQQEKMDICQVRTQSYTSAI